MALGGGPHNIINPLYFNLKNYWDFPGGLVVKNRWFYYRGHGFDPWSGNSDPTSHAAVKK